MCFLFSDVTEMSEHVMGEVLFSRYSRGLWVNLSVKQEEWERKRSKTFVNKFFFVSKTIFKHIYKQDVLFLVIYIYTTT